MRFASICDLCAKSAQARHHLSSALRRARAMRAVAALQLASVVRGGDRITMDEIDDEIAAVRRARTP